MWSQLWQRILPPRRAECRTCGKKVTSLKFALYKFTEASVYPAYFSASFSCDESDPDWRETVAIQGGLVDFKLDSGADVAIIAEATLNQLKHKPFYTKPTRPGGQLACVG